MLVLSRRTNEAVLIDDVIKVEILEIRGNRVRLGIKAPDYIRIARSDSVSLASSRSSARCDCKKRSGPDPNHRAQRTRPPSSHPSRLKEATIEYRSMLEIG